MNEMLERTIAEAACLSDADQQALACLMQEETEIKNGWDERFAKSQDMPAEMARQARERHACGETLPYDPSNGPGN